MKWKGNFLPRFLIAYMLLALLWWSLLLFQKNSEATEFRLRLLQLEQNVLHSTNDYDISTLPAYTEILAKHSRQKWMIIGEGIVFAISLIIGMGLINRAHEKEMEAADKQRNFLLSITHELRSPLASISLILETFLKRDLNTDQVRDLSSNALQENRRLEKQINNLLMATKLDKAYHFNFARENIIPRIRNILNTQRSIHPNLTLDLVAPQDPVMLNVDLEGFHSIMNNIIENAIKYSDEEPVIHIDIREEKNNIIISIADQGVGIPVEERSRVTEQFYRIGNEETRKAKGTGLGLYIVDKILKAHNASMKIEPNTPKGSIFILEFPKS